MRDIVAVAIISVLLGFALGIIVCAVSPAEWHSALHKNAYYPYSVETSVKDR